MSKLVTRRVLYLQSAISSPIGEGLLFNTFEKELIHAGEWTRPGTTDGRFRVTPERMARWVDNFKRHLMPEGIPVTLGHDMSPDRTVGWLEALWIEGASLMGRVKILDEAVAQRVGSLIRGVSLGIDMNFINPESGANEGEVIYHLALTNDPHVKGLEPFEAVLAGRQMEAVVLEYARPKEKEEDHMDQKEETALREKIALLERQKVEADTKAADATQKVTALEADHAGAAEKIAALEAVQTAQATALLAAEVDRKVETLIASGKVLPAERDNVRSILLDGAAVKVTFEAKEMRLLDKLFLTFDRQAPKVKLAPQGRANHGAAAEPVSVTELAALTDDLALGKMTLDEFNKRRGEWLERAQKAGEVEPSARMTVLKK